MLTKCILLFDDSIGEGWGGTPKFPPSPSIRPCNAPTLCPSLFLYNLSHYTLQVLPTPLHGHTFTYIHTFISAFKKQGIYKYLPMRNNSYIQTGILAHLRHTPGCAQPWLSVYIACEVNIMWSVYTGGGDTAIIYTHAQHAPHTHAQHAPHTHTHARTHTHAHTRTQHNERARTNTHTRCTHF